MEWITSRANEQVKYCVKLRESASFRREEGVFLLEGARLAADAASGATELLTLFVTEQALSRYPEETAKLSGRAQKQYLISPEVSGKLSDTVHPQGVFVVCKMLDKCVNIGKIKYNGKYIALEGVSNPQNFGAICRTAEAVGLDGVLVGGGCDIYHPKAQRAAMGSLLRLPVWEAADLPAFLEQLREQGMQVYASVPDKTALPVTRADFSAGAVVVVGNEGNGLTQALKASSTALLTIPMKGRAESLNAAEAASILMWEMMR